MSNVKRKATSKRLRFEVFKRDAFTCQYCGAQPPDIVLVCDHIDPVKLGGMTTIDNLVTSCESCNQGKAANPLGAVAKRPDADLLFLEMQQEIVELKRFKKAEEERDAVLRSIAEFLQQAWMTIADTSYPPAEAIFMQMLSKYSPEIVKEAVLVTAKKEFDGTLRSFESAIPYLWGVAKRISDREEETL